MRVPGIVLVAAACAESPRPVNAVYEALLATVVAEKRAHGTQAIGMLMVARETTGMAFDLPDPVGEEESEHSKWSRYREELNGLQQDTYADFRTANAKRRELTLRQVGALPVRLFAGADLDKVLGPRDSAHARWKRFWAAYPMSAGRMHLSAVGFSKDGRQALAALVATAGPLAGSCRCFLLGRTKHGWKVADTLLVWQS